MMLSGTVVQAVCWCIVLILSVCYKYRDAEDLDGAGLSPQGLDEFSACKLWTGLMG